MRFFNTVDVNDNVVKYSQAQTGSAEVTVLTTDSAELYSFSASDYLAAKFFIQVVSPLGNSIREVIAVHDGSDGYLTEYGIVASTEDLELDNFEFSLTGSTAALSITPTTDDARNIKIFAQLIK
jgi:hypothetical protein